MLHGLPDSLSEHTKRVAPPESGTKLQIRRCAVCGYTRQDAPSAYPSCCVKQMEIIDERAVQQVRSPRVLVIG